MKAIACAICGYTQYFIDIFWYRDYNNLTKTNGTYPLSMAAAVGDADAVDFLIHHGADMDRQNTHGWTPVMWAARCGQLAMTQRLVCYGCDVSLKNKEGNTVLDIAQKLKMSGVVDVMKDAEAHRILSQYA